ncbi:uncharacterized protein [Montipora foliosa]|uniref:uncharacterized protein isoform X1 n=1 Tax=Montipora foliosa TaxID=591990 RepID=UPI0035F161E9
MAREEDLKAQYLEEMPDCLRDLFEQTSSQIELEKRFASHNRSSVQAPNSVFGSCGLKLPPPVLTEEERAEMRQCRREAVKCEVRLFERRREKYSNLILQVMSVMDKIQENRGAKQSTGNVSERAISIEMTETKDALHSEEPFKTGNKRKTWDVPGTRESKEKGSKANSIVDLTENYGSYVSTSESQSEHFHNSFELTSIGRNESRNFEHITRQDLREHASDTQLGFEHADPPLSSTMYKDVAEIKRPFSQLSVISEGVMSDCELSKTLINKQESIQKGRRGLEFDSLASTSLSVAFSDFTNATASSVVEIDKKSPSQQHPDTEAEIANASHYRNLNEQQSSEAQSENLPTNKKYSSGLVENQKSQAISASRGPYPPNQDMTLVSLEQLRQKLLEEKQRHLDALKHQELRRLRKQQKGQFVEFGQASASSYSSTPTHATDRPCSSSMPSIRSPELNQSPVIIDRSSPLRRALSMPPGKMYSILELSGESYDFDVQDHDTELESLSDKENHVVNGDVSVARSDARNVSRNIMRSVNTGRNTDTSFPEKNDCKMSSLPRGSFKVFASDGRDKFAKLSALAKGFLTRLLMKTDKVQGLVKTVKDTRDVLEDMSRDDSQTVQERVLKESVESHLKVARASLHDIFFKIPTKEKMSYITHSRSLARAKQAKRVTKSSAGHSRLSAVTLKSIQRRQEGLETSVRQSENPGAKPKPDLREERKRKNWNIRVLKPQQCHSSPVLPERTRSKGHASRPTTAPERTINSRLYKEETVKRPQTTEPASGKIERPSRLSLGGGNLNQQARRPGRKSLGGINHQPKVAGTLGLTKRTAQPRVQKRLSLPAGTAQPRLKVHVEMNDAMKRPHTASQGKRTSRTLAANFAK